jgi:uncharacterized protein involved in type VI secretion and phage assembly
MGSNTRVFFGKYRGQVVDDKDPLMIGRIRVKVASVFGKNDSGWALPCVPFAGNKVGFFFIPPIGANVWIEFEAGNPESPIWSGCFWGIGEVPDEVTSPQTKVIKTSSSWIVLDDKPGETKMTIETAQGLKIILDASGIQLINGSSKVKLTAASVSINEGALEVI